MSTSTSTICSVAVALCALLGCGGRSRWVPPPGELIPAPPPLVVASTPRPPALAEPPAGPDPSEPPPPPPSAPRVHVEIEQPYKLGERPVPKSREAYQADILERRRWNDGGTGELVGELPGPEGHPDPRVIINVDAVHGPHRAADVQRLVRQQHWIRVVRCYRLGFYKDPELRGWTKVRIDVAASGKPRGPKVLETELKDREVAECMADKLTELALGRARAGSRITLSMRVGPGDDPLPPPDDVLVPGEGKLSVEAMRAGAEAGLGAFEACYRQALGYAPGLWGRIVVRFHLTERGELDEAFETESRFADKRVSQCVLRAARKLTFAKPEGGDLRFEVPLRFWNDAAPP